MCYILINKVKDIIKEYNMLNIGDKVVVGVSGGPDSMCLLNVLCILRSEYNLTIVVAHINHCLRGSDADDDEEFVRNYCKDRNIEFYSTKIDIHHLAKEKGISCESAGREVRYSFFYHVYKEIGADKIALAHHANDQAETILMRLMRGTGMEGLSGIKPVRDNVFIRPLINIYREEIEKYCIENNIYTRTDKTNFESIFTRNKIRLDLIPYINNMFDCDITKSLCRLSNIVRVDNDYLKKITIEKYNKYCVKENDKTIITYEAFKEHEAILSRIIRMAIEEFCGNLNDIEKHHISDIINLQKRITGKIALLPKEFAALNNYGNIEICNLNKLNEDLINKREIKLYEGTNYIYETSYRIFLNTIDGDKDIKLNQSDLIKYFDWDKINGEIKLRYRIEGDRFCPLGLNGSKKLKDIFIDLKIPKHIRNKVPLICFGDEIAWIVGYRISEKFKVDNTTKKMLEVKIESEE